MAGLVGAVGLDLGVELRVAGLEERRQRRLGELAGDGVDLGEALGLAEEGDELLRLAGDPPEPDELGENDDPGDQRKEQQDSENDLGGRSGFAEEGQERGLPGEIFRGDGLKGGQTSSDSTVT